MVAPSTNQPSNSAATPQQDSASPTRLYISPLSTETLSIILPPAQQGFLAQPPTFHSPVAFPEKSFGYLELPKDVADKLRKKLHGSILKGVKMRVEEAKPERGASATTRKRKADVAEENKNDDTETGKRTRRSKRPEEGTTKGEELPAGRKVKRGWDESAGKSKKQDEAEPGETRMVFRTSVPPNKMENASNDAAKSKADKKGKKSKTGNSEIEVKEFDKTEKVPTFLRGSSKPGRQVKTSYDDKKGWVDEDDNVIEEVKTGRKASKGKKKKDDPEDKPVEEPAVTIEVNSAKNGATEAGASDQPELQVQKDSTPQIAIDSTALTDDNANDMDGAVAGVADEPVTKPPSALEALFKRPAPSSKGKQSNRPAPIQTFSFFGDEPAESAENGETHTPDPDVPIDSDTASTLKANLRTRRLAALQIPPQTPFTRRDLESRGLRSAAPTPDTAAIGVRMRPPWKRSQTRSVSREADSRSTSGPPGDRSSLLHETIEEQDEATSGADENGNVTEPASDGVKIKMEQSPEGAINGVEENGKEQTEFEKKFYEQRGDLNRAWKSQRRESRKKGRQASNRRGGKA